MLSEELVPVVLIAIGVILFFVISMLTFGGILIAKIFKAANKEGDLFYDVENDSR